MPRHLRRFLPLPWLLLMAGCAIPADTANRPTIGGLTTFDPAFHAVVAPDARVEKLAEGFTWAEGPAWIPARDGEPGQLLFTDVPENTLYRWSETAGASVLLEPSGHDGADTTGLREPGANGLLVEPDGGVLMADSGSRVVARLDRRTRKKTVLATGFQGKRFNSPNDLARRSDGTVFFTDPPYGLEGLHDSPLKELGFSGVYRLDPDGSVHLLDDRLRFPNGIALSPDERTLYVANSDPDEPVWIAYALDAGGAVQARRVFAEARDLVGEGNPGLPDGMAVAADGTLFATGPGGVLVFAPDGRRLGRIETGTAVANCTFGDDGRMLYLASHTFVARVPVQVRGPGF